MAGQRRMVVALVAFMLALTVRTHDRGGRVLLLLCALRGALGPFGALLFGGSGGTLGAGLGLEVTRSSWRRLCGGLWLLCALLRLGGLLCLRLGHAIAIEHEALLLAREVLARGHLGLDV